MQSNQQERRFTDTPQQPVYRFPQNQPSQSWQPQQRFAPSTFQNVPSQQENTPEQNTDAGWRKPRKRRRIFTLWNAFAVIGLVTVVVQALRYIIIPFLVYLHSITGGAL